MAKVSGPAPPFKAQAVMPDGQIKEISLSDYIGGTAQGTSFVYLMFIPLAFTFVCPTELLAFNQKIEEFKAKKVQVIACSVDSQYTLLQWCSTKKADNGLGGFMGFPIMSDLKHEISRAYGVYHAEIGVALRGSFLIDSTGCIKHATINDLPLGRSVSEALRNVDALTHIETHGEVCPANWTKDAPAMKPTGASAAEYVQKVFP